MAFVGKLWGRYVRALESYPLTTKSVTNAGLMITGDVIAQKFIEEKKSTKENNNILGMDIMRTVRMGTIGLCFSGPMLHYWYKALNKAVPETNLTGIAKKLVLDQTIFAPVILSVFLTANGFLQGRPTSELINKWKTEFYPTLLVNWTVWPPAMLINFRFVPPQYTVLYVNCVALAWNTYLSIVGNKH